MLPAKLGMKDEEDGGKPAIMIAVGKAKPKMPPKLGGDYSEEDDDAGEEILDPKQAMKDATAEIVSCLGGSQQAVKRLNSALEAYHRACDAMIEKEEGEEPGSEEGNE
jgi:hypothetical protein